MRKHFVTFGFAALCFVVGRLSNRESATAQGIGVGAGQGDAPRCRDVNGDGEANVADPVFLLNWLFQGGPAPTCASGNGQPVGLPDTGQTKCYDVGTGNEIACDDPTAVGQDGFYATGCTQNGRRFIDNGDGTVTDYCTGLMWQQDTADVNGDRKIDPGDRTTWRGALDYCESLSFAGHDDWRLPNILELQSIVDYGLSYPYDDPAFGTLSWQYWSSTSIAVAPESAWSVDFADAARVDGLGKDSDVLVRAVRTAQ